MRSLRGGISLQAGMTPLIDVVFLLIVFFVLVSRIVDEDRPRLDLPAPTPPATVVPSPGPRAIVSVVGEDPVQIRMDSVVYPATDQGHARLAADIAGILGREPTAAVQVRAGRDATWQSVAPVLEAARRAGRMASLAQPLRVQLAAVRERGQ